MTTAVDSAGMARALAALSPQKRALLERRLRQAAVRPEAVPLSSAQQRLWFAAQLEPDSSLYNLPTALRLAGPLDAAAVERALGEIVRRHEILRTVFESADGRPVQRVEPWRGRDHWSLPIVDLGALTAAAREPELRRIADEEARLPFDLARGPVMRTVLLRLEPGEHVALLDVHHIVADGWSFRVLREELVALYEAFRHGRPSPLPELPLQYADYALWERRRVESGGLEADLAVWRKRLGGEIPRLRLPADRPWPEVPTHRGASEGWTLSVQATEALREIARGSGATLFMVLLAAFDTLLRRYTGQDDLLVGTPVANRGRPELELLIGLFINTLVLRTDTGGDPPFTELLERVREVSLEAFAHQDVPFDRLVEELQPRRSLGHQPLFQVLFVLQNVPARVHRSEGLDVQPMWADDGTAKFDLTCAAVETPDGLSGGLEYSAELFDAATIRRMLANWTTLLEGIAEDPRRPLSELPLLSAAERKRLAAWNDTAAPFRDGAAVHELFEERAAEAPERVALALEGGVEVTYGELDARANRLARRLLALGAGPEIVVGLCLERSPDMIAAMLAVLKAGAAYLPLDPAYPPQRLAAMLEQGRPALLVSRRSLVGEWTGELPLGEIPLLCLDEEADALARTDPGKPAVRVDPSHLAYVIYTSGSTGQPKGVMVPHRGLCNLAAMEARTFAVEPCDRVLQLFSFSFDASFWDVLMALPNGARLCIANGEARLPGAALEAWLKEQAVTIATLPPSLLRVLPAGELPHLRAIVATGEACPPEVVERWAPGRLFVNGYGPTETTVGTTMGDIRPDSRPEPGPPDIGRPFPNLYVRLLDRTLAPVPVGVPGELYAGGAGVTRGYHHRPDLTAERFVPDPFSDSGGPGARLYRTGDLARYLPSLDGRLEFLGRADEQVQIRGFRVEPDEVRSALSRHPEVRDAAVLAREQDGMTTLVAYVAPRTLSPSELRSFLRERLPDYMVPASWVMLDALPYLPNGKLDRRSLPAPAPERPDLASSYAAPRTPVEERLAAIWAAVLRLERVGIHDNFFELGGDSILSIQVVVRAQEAGLRLSPRHLFQNQTVAELAAVVPEGAEAAPEAEEKLAEEPGPVPPTPVQRWFFERGLPAPHHWNQAVLLETRRPIEPRALRRAVAGLHERHDALRLRARRSGDGWALETIAAAAAEPPFCHLDLGALPAAMRSAALTAAAAALQGSLDLAAGPVARFALFDLGSGEPARLLAVIHHLAVDGVSWRILLDELRAALDGQGLPRTSSFRRWAERLARHAEEEEILAELPFWTAKARRDVPPLPVDRRGGENREGSARSVAVQLDEDETRALLREVPEVYGTRIEEALLAALALAFAPWTGSRRLLVDLEGHGREDLFEEIDLSRTVGWFTTFYPVLLELPPANDPGAALKAVKEQVRAIPRKGIGYGLLRYGPQSAALRSLQGLPAAEVSFNYLGQLGGVLPEGSIFAPAAESSGPLHDPRGARSHAIEINGSIFGGAGERLRFSWTYGEGLHRRETIAALAERFAAALRDLIAHCRQPGSGGYTPSDFSRVDLSQEDLDDLLDELAGNV
jgi:amino acid adenylation domain-containing protein/non-ribosomal peptide synthase protein (TIGR01720 family)